MCAYAPARQRACVPAFPGEVGPEYVVAEMVERLSVRLTTWLVKCAQNVYLRRYNGALRRHCLNVATDLRWPHGLVHCVPGRPPLMQLRMYV